MSWGDILTIVAVAFLSSFSHCYAMCGGFNLALMRLHSASKNPLFFSLAYHLMRVVGYVFLGAICGGLGSIFALNAKIQSLFLFILGIFMVLLALALAFRGKFLLFLEKNILFDAFFKGIMKKFLTLRGLKSVFILGLCNSFVPCGLVYFFLAGAMGRGSVGEGAFVMLIFGLSTLPALIFFVQFSHYLKQNFGRIFSYVSCILIMIYGLKLSLFSLFTF